MLGLRFTQSNIIIIDSEKNAKKIWTLCFLMHFACIDDDFEFQRFIRCESKYVPKSNLINSFDERNADNKPHENNRARFNRRRFHSLLFHSLCVPHLLSCLRVCRSYNFSLRNLKINVHQSKPDQMQRETKNPTEDLEESEFAIKIITNRSNKRWIGLELKTKQQRNKKRKYKIQNPTENGSPILCYCCWFLIVIIIGRILFLFFFLFGICVFVSRIWLIVVAAEPK